jgi:hypothetical protein
MSDGDESDLDDGLVIARKPEQESRPNTQENEKVVPQSPNARGNATEFNLRWVESTHKRILEDVKQGGIEACRWCNILEKWKEYLQAAPFEEVEFGCVRTILQYARLTPIAQPTFFETLRKLGKEILCIKLDDESVRSNLLDQLLTPTSRDSEMYSHFFGPQERWRNDSRYLSNHLDKLHAQYGSSLSQELNKERILGFMVPHIRSNRYHPVELGVILQHLVRDIEGAERWSTLAERLQRNDATSPELVPEAQAFILRCFENIYRARQSLEGAEKRSGTVGVIIFADISADAEHGNMHRSRLDVWYDEEMDRLSQNPHHVQNPLEQCTLRQVRELIRSEEADWNQWKQRIQERRGRDFRVADQPLFQLLGPDKLSSASLMTQVMNSIKSYCEKKKNLRDLAIKSSRRYCVKQGIDDSGSDAQQQAAAAPRGARRVAVFGYTLNSDRRGVPEAAEQSVIVRFVPLTRKCTSDESSISEELDTRVFEVRSIAVGATRR